MATGGPDHYHAAIETLLKEKDIDMVLVFFVTAPFVDLDAIARRIKEATDEVGQAGGDGGRDDRQVVAADRLAARGGAAGLRVRRGRRARPGRHGPLQRSGERREDEPLPESKEDRDAAEAIIEDVRGQGRLPAPGQAFKLLSAYGIPVPRVAEVRSADDLAAAAKAVGFPCVLKVDATEVVHKSDAGGVVLGIGDQAALDAGLRRDEGRAFRGRPTCPTC